MWRPLIGVGVGCLAYVFDLLDIWKACFFRSSALVPSGVRERLPAYARCPQDRPLPLYPSPFLIYRLISAVCITIWEKEVKSME